MIKNKSIRIKNLHLKRFSNFRSFESSIPRKYFKPKKPAIATFIIVLIIFFVLFFFTDYKDIVVKIGLFAFFFTLYQIYDAFTSPYVTVNNDGITLGNIRFIWKEIKRIKTSYDFKNQRVSCQILSKYNVITEEKIESFSFHNYIELSHKIKAFKKKNRDRYTLIR
ncbi:hypothetical protein DSC47_08560 [Elizabethkingia miricola]|uniref:hypothetical protein n=1 Tax=Elizabethkingia bruuniana TaxID=1756149 RepID=UPI00099A4B50|nr:hypothetical protein [Elizabethkingia bruuniana]OPC55269.1 hypothetical protein BAY07_17635 [Elizabethkingia bruuniana]OPC65437.1 hypothetical protein BAY13_19255 [Elizabethkingia bruuniana]RBI91356.1 hypothetical protein DSC47_08560 [Elizabethkingia miricola]